MYRKSVTRINLIIQLNTYNVQKILHWVHSTAITNLKWLQAISRNQAITNRHYITFSARMKIHFRHFTKVERYRRTKWSRITHIGYPKRESFQSVLKSSLRFCAGDVRRQTVRYSGGSNGKRAITDRRQTSPRHHQFRLQSWTLTADDCKTGPRPRVAGQQPGSPELCHADTYWKVSTATLKVIRSEARSHAYICSGDPS
jgi:hypothetical protein